LAKDFSKAFFVGLAWHGVTLDESVG